MTLPGVYNSVTLGIPQIEWVVRQEWKYENEIMTDIKFGEIISP